MVDIEQTSAYALSKIFRCEPRAGVQLAEAVGGCTEVFKLRGKALSEVMGAAIKYRDAIASVDLDKAARELDGITNGKASYGFRDWKGECRYVTRGGKGYPRPLMECEDGPLGLFVLSTDEPEDIFSRENIGIVGTRDITPYGTSWCTKIVTALAGSNVAPTIVSGLAYGVDICAHKTALREGLPTIAVLGTGIWNIYPSAHEVYARQIVETKGSAIICEYPPDVDVLPVNFLSRNRIIAGLSRATILVESKVRGGGMTTAREAASYNRDVMALPGRNDDVRSQGCNQLIQQHIAEPLTSCEDLFHLLGYSTKRGGKGKKGVPVRVFYENTLGKQKAGWAQKILDTIRRHKGMSVDEVTAQTGLPPRDVSFMCRMMEADGFISIDLLQRCIAEN